MPARGTRGDDAQAVHLNRSVGTLVGAFAAPDAPVLDDDLPIPAAVDRAHRTAHHAQRVEASAATRRDEVVLETQAVAHQPRNTVVVRRHACLDTFIAPRALVQIEQQQVTFKDIAAAQAKAWHEAAGKFREAASNVAAARSADVEAALKQMKSDASEAEARLQKVKQAGAESWSVLSAALAESRKAFDQANQAAWDALRGSGSKS